MNRDLLLAEDTSLSLDEVTCDETCLYVSSAVYQMCRNNNTYPTVMHLHDYLLCFPTSVALSLNWDFGQVNAYKSKIEEASTPFLVAGWWQKCAEMMAAIPSSRSLGAMPSTGNDWMLGRSVAQIEAINEESRETGKPAAEVAESSHWRNN